MDHAIFKIDLLSLDGTRIAGAHPWKPGSRSCTSLRDFVMLRPLDIAFGVDVTLLFVAEYGICAEAGGGVVILDLVAGSITHVVGICRPTALFFDSDAGRLVVTDTGDMTCTSHVHTRGATIWIQGCNLLGVSLSPANFGAVSPVTLGFHTPIVKEGVAHLQKQVARLYDHSLRRPLGLVMGPRQQILIADSGNQRLVSSWKCHGRLREHISS